MRTFPAGQFTNRDITSHHLGEDVHGSSPVLDTGNLAGSNPAAQTLARFTGGHIRLRSSAEEHLASNQGVVGSTPTGDSKNPPGFTWESGVIGNTPVLHAGILGSSPGSSTRTFGPTCPDRLLVRTLGFQPGRQGSIPCRGAEKFEVQCEVTQLARVLGCYPRSWRFEPSLRSSGSPGETGKRSRLRPCGRKTCGFDSHGEYKAP